MTGPDEPAPTHTPAAAPGPASAPRRLARAPDFPLTLTRALLETLELRRILYVILTGATAGDGLGFNRAFLWLEDEGRRTLRGQLAVGPLSRADASRIWEAMEAEDFDLGRVMARFETFCHDRDASRLTRVVERVNLALPLPAPGPAEPAADARFAALLARVLTARTSLVVNDAPVSVPHSDLTLSRFALAPLLVADRAIGVLAVDNAFNERAIAPTEVHELQTLANLAAVAVERARLYERLRHMAEVDGLTGLLNRRRFDELLAERFQEARRHDEPLALLLLDADHFKEVNDRCGHLVGDDLLRGLAQVLTGRLRQDDIAARYGGDELVALLPRATGTEALQVAQYLCTAARAVTYGPDADLRASVSVGVAELRADHHRPADLLAAADAALYAAKRAGRDRALLP